MKKAAKGFEGKKLSSTKEIKGRRNWHEQFFRLETKKKNRFGNSVSKQFRKEFLSVLQMVSAAFFS